MPNVFLKPEGLIISRPITSEVNSIDNTSSDVLSQVFANGEIKEGSAWIVPSSYYTPIAQDAILLRAGQNNPAAKAFLAYLQSEPAQQVIESFGYDTP